MNTIALVPLSRGRVVAAGSTAGAGSDLREDLVTLRELGATAVHVHDEDAYAGTQSQWSAVNRFLGAGLQVSWGGGVKSMTQAQQLLDLGVEQVAIGRLAVKEPLWFREACRIFGKKLILDVSRIGADAPAKARGLFDAGHGATLMPGTCDPTLAKEAGVPVWAVVGNAERAAAWENVATAVLMETPDLESSKALERWKGPAKPVRRYPTVRAGVDGTEEE